MGQNVNALEFSCKTVPITIRISHSRFELSFELLTNRLPFELISTDVTSPKWEAIVLIQSPMMTQVGPNRA